MAMGCSFKYKVKILKMFCFSPQEIVMILALEQNLYKPYLLCLNSSEILSYSFTFAST